MLSEEIALKNNHYYYIVTYNFGLMQIRKKERKKRKLYFNNLLHIHQHTFLKYMIHDTVGY